MKRIITLAAAMLLTAAGAVAQNTFKGIVKYKVESTGQVDFKIPEEMATAEIRVSGNDMFTKSSIFTQNELAMVGISTEYLLVQNLTQTRCVDAKMLLQFLSMNDIELENYQGNGKMLLRDTSKESDFDSIEIPDTEPGHFYLEYINGETKQIAGYTAKKIIRHQYDEDGVDHPQEMWYSDEIGPKLNLIFDGIKGMPLQCTVNAGEGRAITYTATEIVKGKVKDTDFMLPDGYENMSEEAFSAFIQEVGEAFELLRD